MNCIKRIIAIALCTALCISLCACRTRTTKDGIKNATQSVTQNAEKKQESVTVRTAETTTKSKQSKDSEKHKDKPSPEPATKKSDTEKHLDTSSVSGNTPQKAPTNQTINRPDKADNKGSGGNDKKDNQGSKDRDEKNEGDKSESNDLDEKDENKPESPYKTAIKKYSEKISAVNAEIFECQKMYAYFELTDDYNCVSDKNSENLILLGAGGYNCAEHKYTQVDDSFVARKNPDIIIKLVSSDVLGAGVTDTQNADEIKSNIASREGWQNVTAVIEDKILIVSESLLETEAGQTFTRLAIAKAMYPALYDDIDLDTAYREMTGSDPDGIYIY